MPSYNPIDAKNMANMPSITITRKIDFTTEFVVRSPSDFGGALDLQALDAGDDADDQRHERRLDHADLESLDRDRFTQTRRKNFGRIPP